MLGEAGSIASLVGVVVSLVGLGFAIWQLAQLRGETRAAREASEATRKAISRELSSEELARLDERIQGLKELHRTGNRQGCLAAYAEIRHLLLEIRRTHPGLSDLERSDILRAIAQISDMEAAVEATDTEIPPDMTSDFNRKLTEFQSTLLPRLEDQLQELV
jgi:hypothetical protein